MTGLRSIAIKVMIFAGISLMLLLVLANTLLNGVGGDTRTFTAEFDDVNGLAVGDDVKAAGVRVGQVKSIELMEDNSGATVEFELVEEQPLLDNTQIIMRYQNLLGQRYLSLYQDPALERGKELSEGDTIPHERGNLVLTKAGFNLTELLNGFRPLFQVLEPADVNTLATSLIKVLQGEGGTIESLLAQTDTLTNFIADRDQIIGEVMTNFQPVLENLTAQDDEISATVIELRNLMAGLARDRKSIGSSIDGISQLVGSTSQLFRDAKVPLTNTSRRLREVAGMLADSRDALREGLPAFGLVFESLGRATSYENALNVYVCSARIEIGNSGEVPLGVPQGYSEVCAG